MKRHEQKLNLMWLVAFNGIAAQFFGGLALFGTLAPAMFFQSRPMQAASNRETMKLALIQLAVGVFILLCTIGAAGFYNRKFSQRLLSNRRAALGWTVALTLLPAVAVMSATAFSIRTCSFG